MTSTHQRRGKAFARLEYATDRAAGGPELRLRMTDEIDLADAVLLDDTLDSIRAVPPCDITIDLSQVTLLSSAGLNFIAAVNNHVVANGHLVTIIDPAPMARRALEICGFDRVMAVTKSDALGGLH